MNASFFYRTFSRFHIIIFNPLEPLKKTLFWRILLFFVFFSKACQEHEYNMSKSIFLAEIHNVYPSWSVFSLWVFERFSKLRKFGKKKRKMRNAIFDLIKGCDIPLGSQAFECAWSFFSSFEKKKTEFRSKKIFSRKLKMLHIWYPIFIFSRISRHTLVLDTYIVTCNSINLYPELAAISVPLRWR